MDLILALAGLSLCVGAGLLAAWLRPRRALARRARRVRAALGTSHRALGPLKTGVRVAIEGTLERAAGASGEGPSNAGEILVRTVLPPGGEWLDDAVPKAETRAEGELLLRTDDGAAHLGPCEVLVGAADTLVPAGGEGVARALFAGDRIVAAGVLFEETEQDAEAKDYRARPTRLVLSPDRDGVVRLAFAGAPAAGGPRLRRYVMHALYGALAFSAALGGVATTRALRPAGAPPQLHCPDIDAYFRRYDIEGAAREAAACGDELGRARAAWLNADFAGTSQALVRAHERGFVVEPSLTEVGAHLLAGRFEAAAAAARALAAGGPVKDAGHRQILECFADALDFRRGDAAARGRLEVVTQNARGPLACAALLADSLDGKARLDFLAGQRFKPTWWLRDDHALDQHTLAFLRYEVDRKAAMELPRDYPAEALRGAKWWALRRPLGLEQVVRERAPFASGIPERLALLFAVVASYLGEHEAAGKEIEHALAPLKAVSYRWNERAGRGNAFRFTLAKPIPDVLALRDHFFYAAVLATRAHEIDNARTLLAVAEEEANGRWFLTPYLDLQETGSANAFSAIIERESWAPHRALWKAAEALDGVAFAKRLEAEGADGRAVIPFVHGKWRTGLSVLKAWARTRYPQACWTCGPHVLIDHLAGRREIAQGLDDDELDAALAPAVRRAHEALLRRDIAIPLWVLARMEVLF